MQKKRSIAASTRPVMILLMFIVPIFMFGCNQKTETVHDKDYQQEQGYINSNEDVVKDLNGEEDTSDNENRKSEETDDTETANKDESNKAETNKDTKDTNKESNNKEQTNNIESIIDKEKISEEAIKVEEAIKIEETIKIDEETVKTDSDRTENKNTEVDHGKTAANQGSSGQEVDDGNTRVIDGDAQSENSGTRQEEPGEPGGTESAQGGTEQVLLGIDIVHLGDRGGIYLNDAKGGWHDLDYTRNLYRFTDTEATRFRLDSVNDSGAQQLIASGFFENDKYYFSKSIVGTGEYNVYEYDLETLECKLLYEGLQDFYRLPLIVYSDSYGGARIANHRGIHYYDGAVYYIDFPVEASSSGIYRLDKGKAPVLLAKQPDFVPSRQADWIVHVDEQGLYYLDYTWTLHRVSLDGTEQYKVTPYQVASNSLLIGDGHVFAHLQDVDGAGRSGLYYADGKGKVTQIVKEQVSKNGGSVFLKPMFVIDNWLYYENNQGDNSSGRNAQLLKTHLQTGEQQVVIDDYLSYTYLGMVQHKAYLLDQHDYLFRLDLQTNELIETQLLSIDSPFQQSIERR